MTMIIETHKWQTETASTVFRIAFLLAFILSSCAVVFCRTAHTEPTIDDRVRPVRPSSVVDLTESGFMFAIESILIKDRTVSNEECFTRSDRVHLSLSRCARLTAISLESSRYLRVASRGYKRSICRDLIYQHASPVAIVWVNRHLAQAINEMKPQSNFDNSSGSTSTVLYRPGYGRRRVDVRADLTPLQVFRFIKAGDKNPSALGVMSNFNLIQEHPERPIYSVMQIRHR